MTGGFPSAAASITGGLVIGGLVTGGLVTGSGSIGLPGILHIWPAALFLHNFLLGPYSRQTFLYFLPSIFWLKPRQTQLPGFGKRGSSSLQGFCTSSHMGASAPHSSPSSIVDVRERWSSSVRPRQDLIVASILSSGTFAAILSFARISTGAPPGGPVLHSPDP